MITLHNLGVIFFTQFLKYVETKCFEKRAYIKKFQIRQKLCSLKIVLLIYTNSHLQLYKAQVVSQDTSEPLKHLKQHMAFV